MYKGHKIRSDHSANREARPSHRRRIQKQAFGIYRGLTPECEADIQEALTEAKLEADKYLAHRAKSPPFVVPKDHGVTYVTRSQVATGLRNSRFRGIRLSAISRGIREYNATHTGSFEVPIQDLDWFGFGSRKLVGELAVAGADETIQEDPEFIIDLLGEASGEGIEVSQPDHITLCKFRRSRKQTPVEDTHKMAVADIVEDQFRQAGIEVVHLGELVLGNGYKDGLLEAA